MQSVFLTSDLGSYIINNQGIKEATVIDNSNGLVSQLKSKLKDRKVLVFCTSSPSSSEKNDMYANLTFQSLKLSGIDFQKLYIIDNRFQGDLNKVIEGADLVILSGGNTKEEIEFYNKIGLGNILEDFDGVILGISAGSINLAQIVYCAPEDISDIGNEVTWQGLGKTKINIEPHFIRSDKGFTEEDKVLRNELLKGSYDFTIYALCDGSHIFDDGKVQNVYGEAYIIKNGVISKPICENGKSYRI